MWCVSLNLKSNERYPDHWYLQWEKVSAVWLAACLSRKQSSGSLVCTFSLRLWPQTAGQCWPGLARHLDISTISCLSVGTVGRRKEAGGRRQEGGHIHLHNITSLHHHIMHLCCHSDSTGYRQYGILYHFGTLTLTLLIIDICRTNCFILVRRKQLQRCRARPGRG